MSRIGKTPVTIPSWVNVSVDGLKVTVNWPKWTLSFEHRPEINVKIEWDLILVSKKTDDKFTAWLYWLTRTLIQNMVDWVTKWFEKRLQIIWVWFSAKVQWSKLNLTLWFSHPVEVDIEEWITVAMDQKEKNLIIVSGIDKQKVWQFSANIRRLKKPEPYKWKWIRYVDEYVLRKAWKSAAK